MNELQIDNVKNQRLVIQIISELIAQNIMTSQNKTTKMSQQAQQCVGALIGHLEQKIWDKVAIKAIEEMRKPILGAQAHRMLKDFAFFNTEMAVKTAYINQDKTKLSGLWEKQLGGFIEFAKKQSRNPVTQGSQATKKLSTRRKHKISEKISTQEKLTTQINSNQTHNKTFFRVFCSEPTQQDAKNDELMRNNKYELIKYNQELEKNEKQQKMLNEERASMQQKKIKAAKEFTFDYEGKLVNVSKKQGEKLKIFNIKSFFKTAPKTIKLNKLVLNQKLSNSQKVTTINNKRLVSCDSKFFEQEAGSSKISHKGKLSLQNNLIDMFKSGGKDVQMGVSITDMANQSKIHRDNSQVKDQNKLNLSQFKEFNSSFKPRARNLTEMAKKTENKVAEQTAHPFEFEKKSEKLFMESEASSKIMSSSFSYFMERSGTIKKNERAYTDNFA